MSVIEEGIKLWLKFMITAVMLIVPSYLVLCLLVGGEAFKATGYEATGHLMTIIGNIISKITTAFGNFLLFIFTNPLTIIMSILFAIYMKYFR